MIKVTLVLYSLVLYLIAPLALIALTRKHSNKPYIGTRWKEYLGIPSVAKSDKPSIWIHTVSVGEVIAASQVIRELRLSYPDTPIIITTTTTTGAERVVNLGIDVIHQYMPFDFTWAVRKFIKHHNPAFLVIMETELWPNTLVTARKMEVGVAVLNARLSEKSYKNYAKFRTIFSKLMSGVSLVLCQHNQDKQRFSKLGVNPNSLHTTGSIKYDFKVSQTQIREAIRLKKILHRNKYCWIASSTHEGEDEILLKIHHSLLTSYPDLLMIIVPRHPERFNDVYKMALGYGFSSVRRSHICESSNTEKVNVLVGDSMGEMQMYLAMSDICFMGGSLLGEAVGGHNVLEPAALSIPTITGPSYFNFKEITESLAEHNGLFIANNADEIFNCIHNLLADEPNRATIGRNANNVFKSNQGSTAKAVNLLRGQINL